MTVLIHSHNSPNFPVLLVQLQMQLSPSDDIYVVGDKQTVETVKRYGSSRSYIFVEVGDYSFSEAVKFAKQNMIENKQEGLLVIDENCIISATLIQSMKRCERDLLKYQVFCPIITQMSPNFRWFAHPLEIDPVSEIDPRCYYTSVRDCKLKARLITSDMVAHLS